ncbi:hypothetical protein FAM22021_000661, partial [Propionibacterium freudenreichii]|nr:hypothetical protein [Propionibacterium freudenreichii]
MTSTTSSRMPHVVGDATDSDVSVTLSDNSVQPVTIAGRDPITDLAVLTLLDTKLTPIPIANSAQVRTGQPVMAVGNPLGLSGTVTTGIVSALNRPVTASEQGTGPSVATVTNAIQTSAPINPGNSGGCSCQWLWRTDRHQLIHRNIGAWAAAVSASGSRFRPTRCPWWPSSSSVTAEPITPSWGSPWQTASQHGGRSRSEVPWSPRWLSVARPTSQ